MPPKPHPKRSSPERGFRVEDALEEDFGERQKRRRGDDEKVVENRDGGEAAAAALEADATPTALLATCFPSHAWMVRPTEGGRTAAGYDRFRDDGESQEDMTAPQEGEFCLFCSVGGESEGKQMTNIRAMWAREIRTHAPNIAALHVVEYYNDVIRPNLLDAPVLTKHMVAEHFHDHEADPMTLLLTQKRDLEMMRKHQVRRMYPVSTATGEAQPLDSVHLKDYLSINAALQKTIELMRALDQQKR